LEISGEEGHHAIRRVDCSRRSHPECSCGTIGKWKAKGSIARRMTAATAAWGKPGSICPCGRYRKEPPGVVSATASLCGLQRHLLGLRLGTRLGRQQGGHPLAVHCRRALHLAHVREFLQDRVEDSPALLLVLHFATAEEDVDQNLVVVLQELPRLFDPGL